MEEDSEESSRGKAGEAKGEAEKEKGEGNAAEQSLLKPVAWKSGPPAVGMTLQEEHDWAKTHPKDVESKEEEEAMEESDVESSVHSLSPDDSESPIQLTPGSEPMCTLHDYGSSRRRKNRKYLSEIPALDKCYLTEEDQEDGEIALRCHVPDNSISFLLRADPRTDPASVYIQIICVCRQITYVGRPLGRNEASLEEILREQQARMTAICPAVNRGNRLLSTRFIKMDRKTERETRWPKESGLDLVMIGEDEQLELTVKMPGASPVVYKYRPLLPREPPAAFKGDPV